MKSAIVALCLIGCALAAPPSDFTAQVLRTSYEQSPEGNFQYAFETDNGILQQASGVQKQVDKDTLALEVTGSSQHKSPEGETFSVTYVADENGYHPQGAHLPTPPAPEPYPEHVVRTLAYIAAHPYVEKKN